MARRRYQKGSLNERAGKWVGRWREDVIENGVVRRIGRNLVIGTKKDFPTKKLALRELERRLSDINSPSYRARPVCSFASFAERWKKDILLHHRPSSQAAEKSHIKRHLVPYFGHLEMKDIGCYEVQSFISEINHLSAKTVRNLVATLREMHNSAKAWGFTSVDWFDGLCLPEWDKPESRSFSEDEIRRIIASAEDPDVRTFFWIVGETGIRLGECCALRPCDFHMDARVVVVRYSAWHGKVTRTKSKRPRMFRISSKLAAHLKEFLAGSEPQGYIFHTRTGGPWFGDDVVKDELKPLLDKLGIEPAGMHAFRHGNSSIMDRLGTPLKVRQNRLGHVSDSDLTLSVYTHCESEDEEAIAEKLGELLAPNQPKISEQELAQMATATERAM